MAYRTRTDDMPLGLAIAVLIFSLVAGIGWIMNVVKIIGSLNEPITAMFIARVVGAFAAPLGAILGWF